MNTKNMKKSQLVELLNEIKKVSKDATRKAKDAADEYSKDPQSRLAFEVGYLNGVIRDINWLLES
jgi:hypothetical protein